MSSRTLRLGGAVLAAVLILVAAGVVLTSHAGGRSCFAGDPKAASPPADAALLAAASRVPSTGQAAIETVGGQMLGARTTIDAEPGSSILSLSGWAVDTVAHALPREVLIVIDGVSVRADTCIARSDVARFFKTPAYDRSGYAARLRILPGAHDVAIEVLAADGKTLYTGSRRLEVRAAEPARAAVTPVVQGGFTTLDGAAIAPEVQGGRPFVHPIGTDLRMTGWMIDASYQTPAAVRAVDVLIDGRVVDRASYGAFRPDVAAFVKAPELQDCGFTARVLTDDLAPGKHRIVLRGIVGGGRHATLLPAVTIELTRPG